MIAEGPGPMLGSAVIGGFILAMIEGTSILINRYSQMFMPQPGMEGKETNLLSYSNICMSDFVFFQKPHLILIKAKWIFQFLNFSVLLPDNHQRLVISREIDFCLFTFSQSPFKNIIVKQRF